jgi:hypothetical protein
MFFNPPNIAGPLQTRADRHWQRGNWIVGLQGVAMTRSAAAVSFRVAFAIDSRFSLLAFLPQFLFWTGRATSCRHGFWRRRMLAFAPSMLSASTLTVAILLLVPATAVAQSDFGTQTLGVTSTPQNFTVVLSAPGVVASVQVLTAGAPGLDFANAGGVPASLHPTPAPAPSRSTSLPRLRGFALGPSF